jgi:hypothetical protein
MKGKPTWKPVGLHAKKWREAAHARGPAIPPLTQHETRGPWQGPTPKRRKAMPAPSETPPLNEK